MSTAFLSALLVALVAGAALPDRPGPIEPAAVDRLNAEDLANRAEQRPGPAYAVRLGAPDVWVLPIMRCTSSSGYGWRPDPFTGAWAMHSGQDLHAPYGTPIYAAHAGTVVAVETLLWEGYGHNVRIDHGGGIITLYAHAASGSITVREGQQVKAGQLIALVGSTGQSTGNHLHFETRTGWGGGRDSWGIPQNPVLFMKNRGVDLRNCVDSAS